MAGLEANTSSYTATVSGPAASPRAAADGCTAITTAAAEQIAIDISISVERENYEFWRWG